jgi:hypothetical protein
MCSIIGGEGWVNRNLQGFRRCGGKDGWHGARIMSPAVGPVRGDHLGVRVEVYWPEAAAEEHGNQYHDAQPDQELGDERPRRLPRF